MHISYMLNHAWIDLNPDEHNQGLYQHPFMVSLDRYDGSCNTFDDPSGWMHVPNIAENGNLNVFNIRRINEPKTLIKHIWCDCKCKFYGRKYNSNKKWNKISADVSVKIQ